MSRRIFPTFEAFVQYHPMYLQNRYGGKCFECGQFVPQFKGSVVKVHGKHRIAHLPIAGHCEGAK